MLMKSHILLLFVICQATFMSSKNEQTQTVQKVSSPDTFIYRQVGNISLKAYVFRPIADGKKHPAILLFHGGAWRLGDASWTSGRAKEFAERGMVGISVEYRLAND